MTANHTCVLLWDLDGTLLTTGRAGVYALEEALREVCGSATSLQGLITSGLTDAQVATLALETCGAATDGEAVDAFLRVYERHLPETLHRRRGRVLAGVREILDDLRSRDDVISLLLTGNTREGARAKLAHYGLHHYFDGGAFCFGLGEREKIARSALELVRGRLGTDPDIERVYVVGDTPHDVRAGKAIGARTIAVASGSHSVAELREHEPGLVLARLPEPGRFRELVGLDRTGRRARSSGWRSRRRRW